MRSWLLTPWLQVLIFIVCLSRPGAAQDASPLFPLISDSEAKSKWVLVVITDEDPLTKSIEKANANHVDALSSHDLWCLPLLRHSMEELIEQRPDLKDRFVVNKLAVGIPSSWQTTQTANLPSRSMVILCDGYQRVLSLAAGVPDKRELIRMVEQAEEVSTLLSLYRDNPLRLSEELLFRAKERVARQYQQFIDEQSIEDFVGQRVEDEQTWRQAFGSYVAKLQPVYRIDTELRFSIPSDANTPRMRVLEQHCETRQDWCESILPWLQGKSLVSVIDSAVDATWQQPPVIDVTEASHHELLQWFQSRQAVSTIVMAVRPDLIAGQIAWPPPNVNLKLRGRTWSDLESAMSKHAYRKVALEELVFLFREFNVEPIVLNQGSRVRYVFFEHGKKKPAIVRESDLPGKYIRRLKID
ncbi:hypothetical protein [Roseiconus lacunae]|uniref:hypothetical protein n=1 Tax=Roseiconus lacunae TaxID=2605694 RepID=UPI0011F20344|nr:hypothetical protein [Roseiconus lacunae]